MLAGTSRRRPRVHRPRRGEHLIAEGNRPRDPALLVDHGFDAGCLYAADRHEDQRTTQTRGNLWRAEIVMDIKRLQGLDQNLAERTGELLFRGVVEVPRV